MSGNNISSVFYAESYHPIQSGSIDGTDILPHDSAIYRAFLCSSAALYDPFGDPKLIGDPYCTLFVGRLSPLTTEHTLRKAMSNYGRVKNLRLVRDIVTGASRGYAFVEYETGREMRRAYEVAHHSIIDDCEIIVDYNRQQLMPGWIPRRLGGGLGGRKESGQLRYGGRDRPFRAPLREIPYDDLKRLGIPPPPEGRYMSRYQVPSPPRRKIDSMERKERSQDGEDRSPPRRKRHSMGREEHSHEKEDRSTLRRKRHSMEREECSQEREDQSPTERKRYSMGREDYSQYQEERHPRRRKRHSMEREEWCQDRKEPSHKRHKHSKHSHRHKRREKRSTSLDHSSDAGTK